jgi:hypothetical protein
MLRVIQKQRERYVPFPYGNVLVYCFEMKGRGKWGLVGEFIFMFSGWRRFFIVTVAFVSIYGDM